jgi:hypothetical protein
LVSFIAPAYRHCLGTAPASLVGWGRFDRNGAGSGELDLRAICDPGVILAAIDDTLPRPATRLTRAGPRGLTGWTVALLTLAALVAGCGTAHTKRDFIARADAICSGALRQARSIAPQSSANGATQQPSALARYLAEVLPVVQSEAAELRALPRPTQDARDRSALASYLRALAQVVQHYQELASAAKRGDAQGIAGAEAALRASPVNSLAASYGLRSCGTPGATSA